ncbi:(S)-N-methylcoclaurine 3'-hydroxylase isozyme 1-like isoform X2 [Ziziphus jujuba]|uniref:(S)-N-methylcoclaurine 3'-hydroxylase isozyme 1-like isoform X2 n=1 Tax=Ziziphus jujuba TaxID=326968 RepID=A0ABM3ICD1_ZIZJJ|nr:(S)-N-methylcoclaurine 3'-hydroxylase isozyme 1-like isoform X2 [Ziziphus jujuba]
MGAFSCPLHSTQVVSSFTASEFNIFHLLFLLIIFVFLKYAGSLFSDRELPLPPGPKPWPIVGNFFLMGKKPHISITQLAKHYGPLISLRLGTQLLVVGSSPVAATEILKTNGRLLSARNQLFSAKAIELQAILREKKVNEMVEFLRTEEGKVVDIGEVVFTTVFDTLANLFFSRDFIGFRNQGIASELKELIWRMMELGTTPNIADFYPLFSRLDVQGRRKKALGCLNEMFGVWEFLIKERREGSHGHSNIKHGDFLDVFLANGFTDEQINVLFLELFTAGTDTTTSTIEWAMAELLKNREAMKRVREELRREIKGDSIAESNISQLPYLQACIKETLRLHPPVPFLLPRRAVESCEVMSYRIPKNSRIFVNVWAIGRDPKIWECPLAFKPERFMVGSKLDFKGHNYEFLPFGAGRRICPGLPMASKQVALVLASLIHFFDWSLSKGEDVAELEMNEKFGVTLQKEESLLAIPKYI